MVRHGDEPSGEPGRWASVQTKTYAGTTLAPLEPEEAAAAVREAPTAVTGDGSVAKDRISVYNPQLRIEKAAGRGEAPRRLVRVRIRDRDRRVVHEVSVEAGAVVENITSEQSSPPFSDAELEDARRLLSGEPGFVDLLAQSSVEVEWFNPGHGPERLLGARLVRVRDHRVVESIAAAVVDLDEERLVEGGDRDE